MNKDAKVILIIVAVFLAVILIPIYGPRYIDNFKDTSKVVKVSGKIFFYSDRFGKKGQTICVLEEGKIIPIEGGLRPAYNAKLKKIMYWGGFDKRGLLIIDLVSGKTPRIPNTRNYGMSNFDWSHNGKKICFATRINDKTNNIYTMNIDGTGLKKLTNYTQTIGWEIGWPKWSPNDKQIAFTGPNMEKSVQPDWAKTPLHPATIYVMNEDGTGVVNLIGKKQLGGSSPAWSPDGEQIVFSGSTGETRRDELFICDLKTLDIKRITHDDFEDRDPAFSPDGKQIAFVSYPRDIKKGSELFVINTDGTNRARLTPPVRRFFGLRWVEDRYPRWYK